jgi:aminomuconate-semialdehyde/2-hydroxymuconate-6-semialdehyde dehydrogenase
MEKTAMQAKTAKQKNTELIRIKNYINGELIEPISDTYIDNYNPATGKVYSLIPDSNDKDVELAVDAAQKAFPSWSTTSVNERSAILLKIADLINLNLEKLSKAESVDNGKPVA